MKKKRNILIGVLLTFGLFINISGNVNAGLTAPTKSIISILEDDLIDGKH